MSDDDPEEPPGRRPALLERLVPPVDQLGEDGQPKPSRMTPREQLVTVGLGFANVAIAAGAATAIQRQQVPVFLAGFVASAIAVLGARIGNRIVAILGLFACVVTRNADTFVFLAFGLPYYAAAMWMFLRYNRLGKAQALLRRQQRSSAKASAAPTRGASGRGTTADKASSKPRPTASKRYTPPKPAKKRPPPPPKPPRDRSIVD